MRKSFLIFLATAMVFSLAPIGVATGAEYRLIGRELSPGILKSSWNYSEGVYSDALFAGKIFDGDYADIGYFSIVLDRVNEGVEICGETTRILALKLVLTFKNGSRLALVMPFGDGEAYWGYDDPGCVDGCVFPGYSEYLFLLGPEPEGGLCLCDAEDGGDDAVALVAKVPDISLKKQRFGSWGPSARGVGGAELNGWLVHTPLLIPAVYGTVTLPD